MVIKIAGSLRLVPSLAGALMLVGAQGARAGLLATADLLTDFQFDGGVVNYHPSPHDLAVTSRNESRLAAKAGGRDSSGFPLSGSDPSGLLYLTAEVSNAGGGDGKSRIVRELSSANTATTPELLTDSLEKMRIDSGLGRFDFLVREGTARGGLMSEYAGPGAYVKLAGLGGTGWMGVYGSLASPAGPPPAVKGPAIPVPATLALFLAAIIPLIRSRRP